jgi:predicted ATPase/DNA-binding winged helix-turn-helix (wHTH) protein
MASLGKIIGVQRPSWAKPTFGESKSQDSALCQHRNAQFRRFRVDLHRRELLASGVAVHIGSRALDILIVLIEARGELVTKDELMSRVWPGTVVEENALQAQISAIRKALGEDRDLIKTNARRGYRFVAEITIPAGQDETSSDSDAALVAQFRASPPPTNLPASISDLVGREAQLSHVADLVAAHRLVTLGGAGGIGKTRLGIELGRCLLPKFADGVWIAELGSLSDPELVLPTIATVLGLAGGSASLERLAAALASKHLLLLLDNCEHVIDAAARSTEALLQAGAALQVIATSREPLRVEGECVHRVPALDVPREGTDDTEDMLRYSAVRLFVGRAREAEARFSLDARSGTAVATICRRLDGIPLAIELAAARAAALGVEGLASRLDDRFRLLTDGRRTALTRHQTLRATLDWSFELLPKPERLVMRRIAVFAGGFTAEAASSVAASGEIAASEVVLGLANLVTKSLVTSDVASTTTNYRLLETTRAYALEKLTESCELDQVARRHAEYFRDLFEQAETEQRTHPTAERLAHYRRWIDDVRAALDWSFSPGGDAMIGVALTVTSERLWFGLSLMDEWRRRVECALSRLRPGVSEGTRREMQLYAALGRALYYTNGPGPEVCAAWTDVLAVAERLDDTEYRLNALWGLWRYRIINGECRAALALAQRFSNLPPDQADTTDLLFGERLLATSLFVLGDLSNARRHLEHVLNPYPAPIRRPRDIRFQLDLPVSTRATLARILWLQGFPDQAMRMAQDNVEDARAIDHVITVCNALDAASMVALAVGDLATAERWGAMLLERSARHALGFWQGWGHIFEGQLLIKRGDVALGVRCLRTGHDELREARFILRRPALLGMLAEGLAGVGQVAQAVLAIDEALAHCERTDERWSMAELLRIRGGLVLLDGTRKAAVMAEDFYRQGVDWARRQGALSWELRCATSLAQLWHERRRTKEAHELLSPVYDRFIEGFETADLKTAKALLDSLQ